MFTAGLITDTIIKWKTLLNREYMALSGRIGKVVKPLIQARFFFFRFGCREKNEYISIPKSFFESYGVNRVVSGDVEVSTVGGLY